MFIVPDLRMGKLRSERERYPRAGPAPCVSGGAGNGTGVSILSTGRRETSQMDSALPVCPPRRPPPRVGKCRGAFWDSKTWAQCGNGHPGLRPYNVSFYSGSRIAQLCFSILSLQIQSNSVLFAKFFENRYGGAGTRTGGIPGWTMHLLGPEHPIRCGKVFHLLPVIHLKDESINAFKR